MSLILDFKVKNGEYVSLNGEKTAAKIKYDGALTVELYYTYKDEPLMMRAAANEVDSARVILNAHSVALFVNGSLSDEEWPQDERLLTPDSVFGGLDVGITEKPTDITVNPFDRRGIKTDEIRIPGVNIGDCMPFSDGRDGRFHLFYLYDRHHHASKWKLGGHNWAHLSTADLRTWDEHPVAVGITEDFEGSICTGSVYADEKDGLPLYYAWYAVRMPSRVKRPLSFATSRDLIRFEKQPGAIYLPDVYDAYTARDPVVFFAKGRYHMLVTTSRTSDGSGALAHLSSPSLSYGDWKDEGPIMAWADIVGIDDPTAKKQPECPDHFKLGDYYYLVFSIEGTARYGYSTDPVSGWIYPENNVIPCGTVPKSAILPSTGERIFTGFTKEGGYAGGLCAAKATARKDGVLEFEEIKLS